MFIFLVFCVVFFVCLSSSCVLCIQCCQCLWMVYYYLDHLGPYMLYIAFNRSENIYIMPYDVYLLNVNLLLKCFVTKQTLKFVLDLQETETPNLWEHLGSPPVLVGPVMFIFLVFCVKHYPFFCGQ
jgi:hypothetical protein